MDSNAKVRLREAIQGLQQGDLQQKPQSTNLGPVEHDQSIPWGLAWHIAAQKEAASVGLPQHSSGRKRKALGLHQGPAAFTKNRNRAGLQGDPESGQRVDPFSRTALGPTQPQEQSWRAAVSATPAAYQSLVPQNDLYGDPKVHGASTPLPQPPFPRKPPKSAAAAAAVAAAEAGGAPTQELPACLFTDTQDAESTTSGRSTAAGKKQPPRTAPAGWGSTFAPRLTDVPRSFWRTVAPDVYHEILQHEFEQAQEHEQQNPLHAMLATLRAKRALAQGDGLQQGPAAHRTAARATEAAATAAAAATTPAKGIGGVGDAPVELKREAVPGGPELNAWQQRDKARAEQAALAAEIMSDASHAPCHIFRGPGARARSRWYFASGEWEWRPCTVISVAPDGTSFAIRWEPENEVARGGIKSVSRFNILFEGEDEHTLESVKAVAHKHQKHLAQVGEHQRTMELLPINEAPHMPHNIAVSILRRVGGFVLPPPPPSPPSHGITAEAHAGAFEGAQGGEAGAPRAPRTRRRGTQSAKSQRPATGPRSEADEHFPGGVQGGGVTFAEGYVVELGGASMDSHVDDTPHDSAHSVHQASSKRQEGRMGDLSRGGKHAPTELLLQLRHASKLHQLGTVPQVDVYHSEHQRREGAHSAKTHAGDTGNGGGPRSAQSASGTQGDASGATSSSLVFMSWRMDQRHLWVKCVHPSAQGRLKDALREADEDFAQVHSQLAYRRTFAALTGMEVPGDDGHLDEQVKQSLQAQVQQHEAGLNNVDLPGTIADNDASVQRLLSNRMLRAHSWTKAHREIASLSSKGDSRGVTPSRHSPLQTRLGSAPAEGSCGRGVLALPSTNVPGQIGARPLSSPFTDRSQAMTQDGASSCVPEESAFYDLNVFQQRVATIQARALLARPVLLPAWQQCTAYLSEIMTRDLFGLNDLPISRVFYLHPDTRQAVRWRKYLESRRRSGLLLLSSQASISSNPMSLVAFLNVQEGACLTEMSDIRQRVCSQLSLIIMDAVHHVHERAAAAETALQEVLTKNPFGSTLSALQAVQANQFDKRDFYRLTSLLNVALYDTLHSLVIENIEAYATGLSLYTTTRFTGQPLFNVVLDAVGEEIRFSPPLESFEAKLIGGIAHILEEVNKLPGFKVVPKDGSAVLPPLDVVPELETPSVVDAYDAEVARALAKIKEILQVSFNRCSDLLASFSRHLNLLSMDGDTLRGQMLDCKDAMQENDWESIMIKQREQGEAVMHDLPLEASLGLFSVDCRALQQRLSDRAAGLVVTVLMTVQHDLEETSSYIIDKLVPLLEVLNQPMNNLVELTKVKDVAFATPAQLAELYTAEQQLRRGEELMVKFKHQMPADLVDRIWQSKRLPVLVEEGVKQVNNSMVTLEARFLQRMREEQGVFAAEIAAATERTMDWNEVFQEELAAEHLGELQQQMEALTAMMERAKENNTMEALAGWKITSYTQLHLLRKQLMPFLELWRLVRAFKEKYQAWMFGPLFAFDLEDLETSVPAWTKITARLAKDLRGLPQRVASKYSTYMIDFEAHLPLLRALRTPGLRQRHWARIKKEMPMLESLDKRQLTLHMMLQAGLGRHVAVLRELADLAARELVIEQSVNSIEEQFNRMTISFTADNDSGIPNVYMLTNGNEIIKFVDDAQLRIKSLSASVYVDPHKESVIQWDEALTSIRAVLEGWLEVQTKWAHLAPLFGPRGLPGQLPLESRKFGDVTREWLKAVSGARAHGKLSELLRHSELPGLMVDLSKGLEAVVKGVMEFLEEKRANFPRFFFLSNNEMVNVLVRSHDPVSVEPFLSRCFPGIKRLIVTTDWGVRIHALVSPEGEKLQLCTPVELVDVHTKKGIDVEMWTMMLERQMRIAMRETLRDALEALPKQAYSAWLLQWPAQSVLLTAALAWCRDVTALYKRGPPFSSSLAKLDAALTTQLLCVVEMIQRQRLTHLQRSVLENVIIGKVYHQDVLARLRESRVESVEDIEWLRVMRFYMEGEVVVRCGYSDISYGLEYLGNSARLVITPLTERAFSSLITAVHLHFGGAPEGPAGTGKTETVKELARCVAKQCIVFNTTEQLDVSHMTRLLMGIASTGAWSCFDEFNRMDMEVLSVVAKQIMTIQTALASGERLFMFEGRNLSVNRSLALFITMNPMYEYRNVLPSNLKALFRPVAMMIPDYKLIAEVSLYAAGFQAASSLASHLVSVLKVAAHRLSNEAHYDFAMRTLKSVLLIAAQLRTTNEGGPLSTDQEASLVRVALLRCNMSKLKTMDAQIFLSVVDREFPQEGSADNYMEDLKKHVAAAAKGKNMHATDDLITRCLQTYAMLQIRTGVMLLGPAACGKSTVVSVLATALSEMDSSKKPPLPPVSCITIFPKAVSPVRLYGAYNTSTQSWEDGVLTKALRNVNGYDETNRAWVILDGPVDHVWVEALNPVLDDNRTLCLSSGETLPLRDGINLLMEMDSISTASPATVSRCGMVYLAAPHYKLWHHMIRAWCAKLPPTLSEYTHKLEVTVNMLFTELAQAYTDALEPDSPLPRQQPTSVLASMFRIMDALLPIVGQKVYHGMEGKPADACIEATALYSVVWAFEASLPQKARAFFNILVRQMSARTINYTKTKYGETTEHSAMGFQVAMPPEGQVFDFMFDYDNIRWVRWRDHVDALLDPQSIANMGPNAFMPFGLANLMGQGNAIVRDCIVTADNLPALYLMRLLLGSCSNILLMGQTGTGKTALVHALIHSADHWMPSGEEEDVVMEADINSKGEAQQPVSGLPRSDTIARATAALGGTSHGEGETVTGKSPFAPMSINLSSQSTATNTSRIIESYLLKRRKGVLGPPVGKIALMFVDDMGSSGMDMHGTQSALELLRQWCSIGGWHDERKATFKTVADTQLVGCTNVNPLKKSIPDRLLQYMSLVALPPISHAGFTLIFTAVLKRYMQPMTTVSHDLLPALVSATMELYRKVTTTLLPVPSRPHYLFSIRHVGAVFKSMFHAHRSSRSTALQLVKLWQHECARVFHDRIVDTKDREWFANTLEEASFKHLSGFADPGRPDARDVVFCTFASFGGQYYELAEYVLRPDHAPTPDAARTPEPPSGLSSFRKEHVEGTEERTSAASDTAAVTPGHSEPLDAIAGGRSVFQSSEVDPGRPATGDSSPPHVHRSHSRRANWDPQQMQEHQDNEQKRSKSKSRVRRRSSSLGLTASSLDSRHSIGSKDKDSKFERQPSLGMRTLPSFPSRNSEIFREELLPPAPGNKLQEIYQEGWVDDGLLRKEEAVHARLKTITAYHAEQYLKQTSARHAKNDADDTKQAKDAKDTGGGSTLVGGSGIVDRVAAVIIHRAALMHVARITRVLSMEQGHMILVGPPGSGRRTLARLSCHMSNVQVFEANLKDTQRGFNWRDTVKTVMHVAGVLGRPVTLLLVDVGRAAEAMLDDVTHLMCTAHLPGLFEQEEQQAIIKSLKPVARAAGMQWSETDRTGASDNVLQEFFVDRCRTNLHVLLLLESNDAALQRLIIAFPKLFHLATLNVVDDWDGDACSQVSTCVLDSAEALNLDWDVFKKTIQACVAMHSIAQKISADYNTKSGGQTVYHVTAYQFLQLLLRIKEQLPKRRAVLSNDSVKYMEGVQKMESMTEQLTRLQDEIAAMQPKLQDRKAETSQLMGLIHEERLEAEAALAAIIPEEEQAKAAAQRKAVLVGECEAELNKVLPPLLKVLKELRNIDKGSIAELKVMKSPPAGVKLVMRAVCIMLGRVPDALKGGRAKDAHTVVQAFWEESIRVLSDFHFLDSLLTYDKDAIEPEVAAQIQQFVHDPAFNPSMVSRSSRSAAVLGKWVIAIDAYQHVKKVVDPKRQALRWAEEELKAQEARLKDAQEHLATINAKIREFEGKYAEANAAKEALAADLNAAQAKVTQAQRVLNVVKQEVERWNRSGMDSDLKHKQVLGEALLASAYIAYMGPVSGSYREQAESEWYKAMDEIGIMMSPNFSLAAFGGDTMVLEQWRDAGLPESKNAVENALIMQQSPQWKMLIDPQEVGNTFLRGHFGTKDSAGKRKAASPKASTKPQPFMVANQSNPGFKEDLMRAIETGAVLLLENLDEDMDDMIEQVLQQNTFHNHHGEMCIKLGDASALYNPKFQMFVTTRLSNPRFPSNLLRHMCVINFSITKLQLRELLITTTLKHEMPKVENEHGILIKQKAKNTVEIIHLEAQLLDAINVTSTEALLGESEVFTMLVALQTAASDIKAKVQRIEQSQSKINQVRQTMDKHLASKVVVYFFTLMDMAHIRHTYQFSLKWFMSLFRDSLNTCPRSNAGQERLDSLALHFTNLLYTSVSRSLFDEDKLPFAVLLLARFTHASGKCTREEANLLLFGRPDPGRGSLARVSEIGQSNKASSSMLPPPFMKAPSRGVALGEGETSQQQQQQQKQQQQQPLQYVPPKGGGMDALGGMFQGSGNTAAAKRQSRQTLPPMPSGASNKRGDGAQSDKNAPTTAIGSSSKAGTALKGAMAKKATTGAGGALQLGSNIPDFMELSAPAIMPQELCPPWLPEDSWLRLKDLGKVFPYNKVLPEVLADPKAREPLYHFYVGLTIASNDLPESPHTRIANLTPFQRLLFIRCMQPRAFLPAAKWAVGAILGPACTMAEPVDLDNAFPMSSATMPIVLISSTDQPLPQLMLFAEQQVVKMHHMAIGRGQGASADKLIRNSVRDPVWVVLENTHLAGDYMPQLCSLVQALPTMSPHSDFRLWLTTIPTEDFPGVILQAALKFVMDPPAGLQSNLVSVMSALPRNIMAKVGAVALPQANPEDLTSFSTNTGMVAPGKSGSPSHIPQPLAFAASRAKVPDPAAPPPPLGMEWKMLVLRLCLFHAILLERRHYKALSFRRPYDFTAADFLSTIKQVQQVHKELMSSASALAPGGDLEAVNRALPGLLYVDGQCLYGGKVSQDWDRRLLVSLLQQQLMPGCAPNPCGDVTLPHVDMLMPSVKKHLSAGVLTEMYQLENVIKEVRLLHLDPADPTLVGLTAGASVVRQAQQTRHTLNILKRVHLMQSNDSEAGSQPMQVALSMAQDLTRQLPFTVLPTVVSAWVALVQCKAPQSLTPQRPSMPSSTSTAPVDSTKQQQQHRQGMAEGDTQGTESALRNTTAVTGGVEGGDQHRSTLKHSVMMAEGPDAEAKGGGGNIEGGRSSTPGSSAGTAGADANAGVAYARAAAGAGAAAGVAAAGGNMEQPKPAGPVRAVNRARQLKMTEAISEQALARWQAMGEYERKMMVQVFEAEVLCYQAVLNAVHASLKLVMSAIKGFDPVRGEFQDLIKQLSSNEVPTQWLDAVPGLALNAEGIGTWVSDLQERLAFIYRWACEGPPVVVPLGMLAKPKAYLISVQQIHAEKQNVAVGSLTVRCCILDQPDSMSTKAMHMSPEEMREVEVCTNEGGCLSLLQCWQFGCLVNGVTLQGAQWDSDKCCLTEPAPTHIFCPMPLLWLVPMRERQSTKGSHWRMLNKTVNVREELEGVGSMDIEGLVTGKSRHIPEHGRQDNLRVRRTTTTGGFEAKLRDKRLRAKSKSPRRFSVIGEGDDAESPTEDNAEDGKGPAEPIKPLDSVLQDLWGLDQGVKQQERYDCPVYLHTHSFGGRVSNRSVDVEDCLFDLKLPTGKHSPMHWITRNVVMLVAPYSLRE